MSALKETIQADIRDAMRQRDEHRRDALRLLYDAIRKREIDGQLDADDATVLTIIEKLIKQRREAAAQYQSAGRHELAERELFEADTMAAYLPAQMSEEEVAQCVTAAISKTSASGMADMGKVMGVLKPELNGRADMALVSRLVKSRLGS